MKNSCFITHWITRSLVVSAVLLSFQGNAQESNAQEDSVQEDSVQDAVQIGSGQLAFFESKVRPLLVQHCYECHSSESDSIEAGLLLDSKWGWETGGDSGPALVPHSPEDSLLIEAVRYEEDAISGMPPKSKLRDADIAILEKWVSMGAPDPRTKQPHSEAGTNENSFDLEKRFKEHWSWRTIQQVTPPKVTNQDWPNGAIDQFILFDQEKIGLQPAQPSTRRQWLRRVHFDLIGLPPSAQQIEAFLNDPSEDAHETVVNQLLRSEQFGEKWARHWLDLVRYAESYGHEFDYELPFASEYRDYVIRALNADVPYDQFVREHLAGDLLERPRLNKELGFNESVIGTGFWYLHEATHAPTDVLGNEADIMDNQIDVFGKTFLGLTVACARCHDHKFDAISTADYYALSAHIQSSCRQQFNLDVNQQAANAKQKIRDSLELATKKIAEAIDRNPAIIELLANTSRAVELPTHLLPEPESSDAQNNKEEAETALLFADFEENSLPEGWSTTNDSFEPIGSRLIVRSDGSLAMPGTIDSGRSGNKQVGILRSPTFLIEKNNIHFLAKSTANLKIQVVIDNYQMTSYNGLLFGGTLLKGEGTNTGGKWAWKSIGGNLRKYVGHRCYLEFIDPGDAEIAIDKIIFSDHAAPKISEPTEINPDQLKELLSQAIADLSRGKANRWLSWQSAQATSMLEMINSDVKKQFDEAKKQNQTIPAPRFAIAMAQGTFEDASVYIRGSHTNPGQTVPARNLTSLGGVKGTRLDLANQLTGPENPLTSRVVVNRIWHHLFGTGIVPTVDDFGPQGQPPTHPALLDWLAKDLMDADWSLKHTIRLMVLSATYRQSSVASPAIRSEHLALKDPTNRTLYKMPVRRLTGESIRDAMLFISGNLDSTQFGRGIPTHRTAFMTGRGARGSGPLDGAGRRSIYLAVYRNFLNPFFATFDTPSPFGPQGRRSTSNVPAQALTLMNDPLVIDLSKRWGKKIAEDKEKSVDDRIRQMVLAAHGTQTSDEQISVYDQFLTSQSKIYGKIDERAWSDLAHSLFGMKAFYFLR